MKNFIREKLAANQIVYGLWSVIPNPVLTEMISLAQFDFQILDLEHGSYDFTSLENSIRTAELLGCSPLVRVPGLDLCATQKALDFGAHGVIYPQVQNFAEAKKAIGLTKYPPEGTRGFNPFTRVDGYSITGPSGRNTNAFGMSGLIIENKTAAQELDQILELPSLEIIYLGAYDMSVALGKPGDMNNPELVSFIESSIKKIAKANKIAGVMATTPAMNKKMVDLGARLIVSGVDSFLIGKSLKDIREQFR